MSRYRRRRWEPGELALLRMHYANTPTAKLASMLGRPVSAVYQRALGMGLRKSAEYLSGPHAARLNAADSRGAASRFPKGNEPWNKGRRWDSGGRSHETRFRKGDLAGRAAELCAPIGTEVRDPDGYLKRKVADDRSAPSRRNWRPVHLLLWEEHHGPVPPGCAVVFRNGDKDDIRIDNLELLTRAELMARNSIHRYPPELKHAIRLTKKLRRTIAEQEKRA